MAALVAPCSFGGLAERRVVGMGTVAWPGVHDVCGAEVSLPLALGRFHTAVAEMLAAARQLELRQRGGSPLQCAVVVLYIGDGEGADQPRFAGFSKAPHRAGVRHR